MAGDPLSRRVITDQCAAPDLAWTQGRATWRSDSSPPPSSRLPDDRPDLYRHRRSPSREDRRGHFYEVRRPAPPPPPGRRSPLDDRGARDARRSPRQSRRSYKDEYRLSVQTDERRGAADGLERPACEERLQERLGAAEELQRTCSRTEMCRVQLPQVSPRYYSETIVVICYALIFEISWQVC